MGDELFAGVDVGTTNTKAIIFDLSGRPVAHAAVPTPTDRPRSGWAQHDPEQLWEAAVSALRAALAEVEDPAAVRGVAVASMAEAGVPLDERGRPTYDVIAWFDPRTAEQGRRFVEAVGAERLAALTGLRPQPIYSVCKLRWLAEHEADAFARTRSWLHVADFIAYRLSGEQATDHSLASRTAALDLNHLTWSEELLAAAELPASVLAPLVWAGTRLGSVTDDAATATGLPADAAVAAGGHDHVCGALGAAVIDAGRALDSMGTAESILVPTRRAPTGGHPLRQRYSCGAHVVADRWYLSGGVHAAGASVDWILDLLAGGEERDRLLADAADVPPGALGVGFLPDLRGGDGTGVARSALMGLRPDVGAPALVRGVLEGLAFAFRNALETVVEHATHDGGAEVRAIGGGARNDLLLRIKATVLGRPVWRVRTEEATGRGAALLGAVGAGLFPDAVTAADSLELQLDEVAPDHDRVDDYQARYEAVTAADYQALRSVSQRLAELADR
ncbi:MAG: FGGY family carbohydrate kinase [Actinomycetota bacterium]|nr:FGGY family carbohydrate kinase [Actinomycetota bacterium]